MEEEVILNKILRDAEEKARAIVEEAKSKAYEIEKKYIQQISKKADTEIENIKMVIKRNKETEIEKAELDSRITILEKKHEKIKAVKDEVYKKIRNLTERELSEIYKNIISKFSKKDNLEIILPEKNREEISNELKKLGVKISNETLNNKTGMIIKEGKIEYNYCFEEILNFNNDKIEKLIANILFS